MEINKYQFGEIVIDGERYTSDVIIYNNHVDSSWWRKQGHSLCKEDIENVFKEKPQVLVVGTGNYGYMIVPDEVVKLVESQGIQIIVQNTDNACKTYNKLKKDKEIIACLHLTC